MPHAIYQSTYVRALFAW